MRRLQKVRADRAQRPWESRDRVRACAVSLSSSLSARCLSSNLLLLCVFVLCRCKLDCLIEYLASFEIRVAIVILNAKNLTAAEVLRNLCCFYWQSIMSERKVRQWVRQLKDGRTNVQNEDRSDRPPGREIKKQM
jgi:hypothetical protein